jgi:hypothetical protein
MRGAAVFDCAHVNEGSRRSIAARPNGALRSTDVSFGMVASGVANQLSVSVAAAGGPDGG